MQEKDIDQVLKYGDKVVLRCQEDLKCYYLMAKSPNDQQLYVVESEVKQSKDKYFSFSLYNFQAQMIFQVYPKLLHEAALRYLKLSSITTQKESNSKGSKQNFMQDKSKNLIQDIQTSLLRKRMEAEKETNLNLIKSHKGQPVEYGDLIMLYHSLSSSFMMATNKTLKRSAEFTRQYLFCLDRQLSSSMYFTIQPDSLTFDKKATTQVKLYDQFQLLTYKQMTMPRFNNLSEIPTLPQISNKSFNYDHDDTFLTLPLIMENQSMFKYYKAYHKIAEADTKEERSQNALSVMVVPTDSKDRNSLCYGQFIRIKFYKQNVMDKKNPQKKTAQTSDNVEVNEKNSQNISKGYISSSINAIGLSPQVFLQVQGLTNDQYMEKISSIFQIVPESDQSYGKPVILNIGQQSQTIGYVHLTLRHLLSGKFLKISKRRKLILSNDLTNQFISDLDIFRNSSQVNVNQIVDPLKGKQQRNMPSIKLYRDFQKSLCDSPLEDLIIQGQDSVITGGPSNQQFNKSQNLMDNEISNNFGQKEQILFVMKLGQSPNVSREYVKFPTNNFFNMASFDSQYVIEVELGEGKEIAYQEKLTSKFEKFTNYSEEASPHQKYQKVIRDEFCIILPNFEQTSKRLRLNLGAQEKEIIVFVEEVEKILASKKIDVGHFKQVNYTFMHTFANLNPLKMSYYDINGSEEFVGSNFWFETVPEQEIKDYNEVISLLDPLITLSKHPISFAIIRYQGSLPFQLKKNIHQGIKNPSQSTSEKILCDEVQEAQNQAITNIQAAVKSIEGLQHWLCGNQNGLEIHSNHQDPLPMRLTIFREIGIIDLVVKILYEMYVHGWLQNKLQTGDYVIENGNFSSRVQQITDQDDNIVSIEIDLLSNSISNFLLLVVKGSYENSLYVVQWYLLFKQILLEGKLIDSMRLDLLLMSLFQQTEINITFQFEVESLARDASFQQYNKHAYNLLISFCLHSSYRTRDSLEELLNQIFSLNKDTIFAEFNYNSEQKAIQLRKARDDQDWINLTQPYNEGALLSPQIISPKTNKSSFQFQGTQFISRLQVSEYMISCVRLITELSKSNPSMVIKYISCILPFMTCVKIIQDLHISPVIRTQILDFQKSSYMQHDFRELRTIAFPQFIKFKNKQSENRILNRIQLGGLQNEDAITYHFYFSQKKISDIYKRLQSKYLQKSDKEDQQSMNIQDIVSIYIDQMLDGKSIHDIKAFEHQYLQQLLRTFILIFSKGLFISIFQKDEKNFTKIYAQFIKFLKTSVTSATNSEPQNKSASYKSGTKQRLDPIVLSENDEDCYRTAEPSRRSKTYINNLNQSITRNVVWLDELIDIINLLEQYQQNLLLDNFVQDTKTDKIFDEFSALEDHQSKNKEQMIDKLKDMKSLSSHFVIRGKTRRLRTHPNLTQGLKEDNSSNKELFQLVQEISRQKKQMILDFSNKIIYGHENIFDQLAELLSFNQTRLSAAIIDLLWTTYTRKSTFLSTINNLCVMNAREHSYILNKNQDQEEKQRLIDEHSQESIYTEFTAIFWRIHFALTALSGENNDPKNYDTINDALSDILMIFYPDYAAKTDIQNFIELNQMENEERHHGAYEQPIVKSKIKQEKMVDQIEIQQIEDIQQNSRFQEQNEPILNTLERNISPNYEDKSNNNFQQHLDPLIDSPVNALKRVSKFVANVFDLEADSNELDDNTTLWKIHHSLSIDVSHICYRQKILRYLGFHELIKKIFNSLIQDTNGNIFGERNKQKDQQKNKQWDIMNEVLEKSTMFLLFFVLRNEENQEIILKDNIMQTNTLNHRESSFGKNNYLQLLAETENKQFQQLVYNLMAELFKNNYQILFNLERHTEVNGIIAKLFKKFEHNLQKNNLESCIYFLQFIPSLIKIKDTDIIQNNELIIQMFKTSKLGIIKKVQALLKKSYDFKIEQNLRGLDATPRQSPMSQNPQEILGNINMPLEICFLTEIFSLTRQIGSKSSFSIDDFAKNLMPIQLIQEAIQQLDEWYPLKLSILLYFQQVYLDNSNLAGQDEKNEVQSFIMDCVFKQLTKALTENQNLVQNRYNRVILNNPLLFNVLQQRTFFSTQEVLYKLDYEHTAYLYIIYGVIEVTKNFIKKVIPECMEPVHNNYTEQVGNFDEQIKEDLLFVSSSVLEVVESVQNFLSSHPEQSQNYFSGRKYAPNLSLDKTQIKPKHTRIMTKKMNTFAFQNKEFEELASENSEIHLVENENLESLYALRRSLQICNELQQSSIAHLAMKKVQLNQKDKQIFQLWESAILGSKKKLIDETYIQNEKEQEIQILVSHIVGIRNQNIEKFQNLISSMIVILSEDIVSPATKSKSMTILRKISNYKEDPVIAQSILIDLGELGYTDFLCDLICTEENNDQKLEYIKGFVEYLDDSSFQVQIFLYDYLVKDHQNRFLICLQSYLSNMFDDIKLSEKGRKDTLNKQQKSQLKIIIDQKINSCISVLELLRLGCENHYRDMQNFFRNGQTKSSVKTEERRGQINIIVYVANLFEKYSQIMNEYNPELGEKMIDFLIELVQGPCIENQEELCQKTRILEVLEEVNLSLRLKLVDSNHFTSKDLQFCSFRYKIFLLQLSMMEGNTNEEIPKRISQFFNPQLLLERIEAVYSKAVKRTKRNNLHVTKSKYNPSDSFDKKNNISNIDFYVKDNINKTFNTDNGMMEFMKEDFYYELQADFAEESLNDEKQEQIINNISALQCDLMVNECFLIYILLKKLKKFVPQIQEFTRQSGKHLKKAINYFRNQTSSIEIINMHGKLEKVYFPIPRLMQYLSAESQISFLEVVSRESINDKINGLLGEVDNFYLEMEYYEKLHKVGLRYNNTSIYYLRNLCLVIAVTINILLLINEDYLNPVIKVLGVINIIFYCFILFLWCLFRMSLEYQKISGLITKYVLLLYPKKKSQKKRDSNTKANIIWTILVVQHMTINSYTFYWMVLVILGLLGILYSPLYFGFLLLDIIDHSVVLKNVIRSITLNYQQLLMTALLGILIFYLYSIISFQSDSFRSTLQDSGNPNMIVCYTPFQCFIYMMHQGLRAGGGIGDDLVQPDPNSDPDTFFKRVIFDLSFYLIINVIWLNIIFGIIIDTFAELRDEKNLRDYDSQNKCFICNLSRSLFEKEGVSFDKHIGKQHYIWSYLAYLIHLKVKDERDFTGIESYIWLKVVKQDISWLPILKAIKLEDLGVKVVNDEQD